MRLIVALIAGVVFAGTAAAQGFEWEWSPRLPQVMPIRYVGVEVSAGYALQHADLLYSEEYLPCCRFTKGFGLPIGVMMFAEQWTKPWLAYQVSAGVNYQAVNLTAGGDTLPRIGPDDVVRTVITEWKLATSMLYGTLGVGGRARLMDSHFSVGVQLRGSFRLGGGNATLSEHIVSPSDYYFNVQGRQTTERAVDSTSFAQRAALYVEPALFLQYDLPLSLGMVLSPLIQVSTPITSLSSVNSWGYYNVSFGVRLSRGL